MEVDSNRSDSCFVGFEVIARGRVRRGEDELFATASLPESCDETAVRAALAREFAEGRWFRRDEVLHMQYVNGVLMQDGKPVRREPIIV